MKKIFLLVFVTFIIQASPIFAQNNRVEDNNNIGWYAFFMNYKLADKWSLHGEFQWRRINWISDPQQNLYRTGLNYQLHPQVTLRVGYAYADTYNYGEIPINGSGMRFPEHRTYLMALVSNPIGKVSLSHRFMLEQRWVGRNSNPNEKVIDDYVYVNRARYMFRMDLPLKGNTLDDKEPYLAAYDELLIGFGKNVNQNIFDQNRIGILVGFKFSRTTRIEAGYFNQTLQLGRLVEGKNVFQHNNGFIINTFINF
ncbi:DUF2490 domain-containing protein [Shivajiella indica]|uniref:DUF2490 domain-containing protein n=1 Tax=Shivajiella indica TaxID=872115 RepID=A0ABW5B944_9BACT